MDTPFPFSLDGVKNAANRTPFSGQTFLYERALGCKLVSTRATSTSLHVQWSASYVTSGREFEASFSDSNRVESELLKPSYQSGSSHAAESLERNCRFFLLPSLLSPFHWLITSTSEDYTFFYLFFTPHFFLFNNFNYYINKKTFYCLFLLLTYISYYSLL